MVQPFFQPAQGALSRPTSQAAWAASPPRRKPPAPPGRRFPGPRRRGDSHHTAGQKALQGPLKAVPPRGPETVPPGPLPPWSPRERRRRIRLRRGTAPSRRPPGPPARPGDPYGPAGALSLYLRRLLRCRDSFSGHNSLLSSSKNGAYFTLSSQAVPRKTAHGHFRAHFRRKREAKSSAGVSAAAISAIVPRLERKSFTIL